MQTLRLFIASDLSPDIISKLIHFQSQLGKELKQVPIRWVEAKTMHLTLQFLGDVPKNQISTIQEIINSLALQFNIFSIQIAGAGAFPSFKKPQVLWLGISADKSLKKMAEMLQNQLEPLGFEPENSFVPHLTLGRLNRMADGNQQKLVSAVLARWQQVDIGEDYCKEITLYQSELTRNGPVYTALHRAPLQNVLN